MTCLSLQFNPLMLAAVKSGLTILGNSFRPKQSQEIFEEESLIKILPRRLRQIFCKIILDF